MQVGDDEIELNPGAEGLARAEAHGCTVVSGIEDLGEGISIAHLMSPSGDRFGLIVNPHFKVDSS